MQADGSRYAIYNSVMKKYRDIDEYIRAFPKDVQMLLTQMRMTIKKTAPKATEAIVYGIPTFKLGHNLVHFGGFKDHVSHSGLE